MGWDDSFFESVLKSGEVRNLVSQKADEAIAAAQSIAPVKTGKYKASIKKEVRTGQKRCYAYVYSDVDYSIPVEMYHGTMTRAAGRIGGN